MSVAAAQDVQQAAVAPSKQEGGQETALARLPALPQSQDVRRNQASLSSSPFGWAPVWNRAQNTSYFHSLHRNETRTGEEDHPGPYRIVHPGPTGVSSWVNSLTSDVATLWTNVGVEVLAVVYREDLKRVRARIKRPPGWISLLNIENGYRWAVKADVFIYVIDALNAPEINGRYERDGTETRSGDREYPRFKQVNGDYFIRLSYSDAAIWMITPVGDGPPKDNVKCDSRFYDDPFPPSLRSLPPPFPAAWSSSHPGMHDPMPSLIISWANEGVGKKRTGKPHLVLGVLRLDYGYDPLANEVDTFASMGYDVLYQVVPMLTPDAVVGPHLAERIKRNFLGAVQRLHQRGANAITGDCGFMMTSQPFAQEVSSQPIFMSSLVQWPTIACAFAASDTFLVITAHSSRLASQEGVLLPTCKLNLKEDRFVVHDCQALPSIDMVPKGEAVPDATLEVALVDMVVGILKDSVQIRGILIECIGLLPYTDAVRAATNLPVWDAVTAADLLISAYGRCARFGLEDWQYELVHMHDGTRPGPVAQASEANLTASAGYTGKVRILGVLTLDYENPEAPRDYVSYGSQEYQILFCYIPELTRYLTSLGKLTKACEKKLKDTISWMEGQGACAITGDCGFMMAYQLLLRDFASVPLFLSPMIQCHMVPLVVNTKSKVLVLTAVSADLDEERKIMLSHCGFDMGDSRYIICGCEGVAGFCVVGGQPMDVQHVLPGLLKMVTHALEEWPAVGVHVGAICVECAQLLPYSDALRHETGLPVFDAITCCDFLVSARKDSPRFGIKQWPYVWDRKIAELEHG